MCLFSPSFLFLSPLASSDLVCYSFFGMFWKFARIGERLSPYVSICCMVMAVSGLIPIFLRKGGGGWMGEWVNGTNWEGGMVVLGCYFCFLGARVGVFAFVK